MATLDELKETLEHIAKNNRGGHIEIIGDEDNRKLKKVLEVLDDHPDVTINFFENATDYRNRHHGLRRVQGMMENRTFVIQVLKGSEWEYFGPKDNEIQQSMQDIRGRSEGQIR